MMRLAPRLARALPAVLALFAWLAAPPAAAGADVAAAKPGGTPPKVLRYAFRAAETTFDPAQLTDLYSRIVTGHIFEGLIGYDPLARPALLRPQVITAMPEIEDDFRTFTFHLRPGIFFADDPAFDGRRRELVAADFVYTFKRVADPLTRSPNWADIEQQEIVGLAEQRQRATDGRKPFDYAAPVAGLEAVDRYTLRLRLAQPRPRLLQVLAQGDLFGAMAHEVVERYGANVGAHPVGTGPFRLAEWRRASKVVLERNPGYREVRYDARPAPDDVEGQAILARFHGRRLPMIDRVEVSIIEQAQPRWLSFLNGDADLLAPLPEDFIDIALPGGKLSRNLQKQGLRSYRLVAPDAVLTMFNMEDPVVGGYTPEHVALRRAIALAMDCRREARIARHGQLTPAQSQVVPNGSGFDPAFKSEMSDYDPGRARALLDMMGYVDRDNDGWRDLPDGRPLTLVIANQNDATSHLLGELWQRNMSLVGLRTQFTIAQWPENLKAARAGASMIWDVSSSASTPDGQQAFQRLYGPASGGQNLARFRSDEFDALYQRMLVLPDGPERDALFLDAKRMAVALMPYKVHGHRIVTDLAWPQLVGFRRPLFWQDWWQYVDIETPRRPS